MVSEWGVEVNNEGWMRHTAAHVKLGTTAGASNVKSNDLSAKKVVSSCDIRGDLHIHPSTALVQIFNAPIIIIGAVTGRVLVNH